MISLEALVRGLHIHRLAHRHHDRFMGTPKGIVWRLIAQSEPRLAEIICINILEALPCLQDDAPIVEQQPHTTTHTHTHTERERERERDTKQPSYFMLILGIPTLHTRSRDASKPQPTLILDLEQASIFGEQKKTDITAIHALSRPHDCKAAYRLPFLPRREPSRAV